MSFRASDVPDQTGRLAVITGSNTGLGLETARILAAKGATVLLACRNPDKAADAIQELKAGNPTAEVLFEAIDLSDLASVRAFGLRLRERFDKVDVLINNAGVMAPPASTTKDGFELQIGVNHLGHFTLTAELMPLLLAAEAPRVVNVASIAHRQGTMDLSDPHWRSRRYSRWPAYGQSKLANLLFSHGLARRVSDAGLELKVMAAHPGVSGTELSRHLPFGNFFAGFFGSKPEDGAMSQVFAATALNATHDGYYGPQGFQEMWGEVGEATQASKATDTAMQDAFWAWSVKETGAEWPALG